MLLGMPFIDARTVSTMASVSIVSMSILSLNRSFSMVFARAGPIIATVLTSLSIHSLTAAPLELSCAYIFPVESTETMRGASLVHFM